MIQPRPDNSPDTVQQARHLRAWLTLAHLPGMQSRLFNQLLDTFHSPATILASDRARLVETGLAADLATRIEQAGKDTIPDTVKQAVDESLAWREKAGHYILTLASPDYPPLLAAIPDPPPLLYIKGSADCLHLPLLAMVGSRRPSADGRRHARRFARQFAEGGIGVCSGLALGVDAESHRGALEGAGMTVAVLGTGIDRVYPGGNADLFGRIVEQGALVSEFNPGTRPYASNFPQRNRVISGLSLGVLVVEAGLKSGSMITARFALEQGREVFAIPGSINNPMTRGCHRLIANGACLVNSAPEVVAECGPLLGGLARHIQDDSRTAADAVLNADQRQMKAVIGHDPVPLDTLVQDSGMDVSRASVVLVELEMQGIIRRTAAGYSLAVPD